jgi:hypothetical protein
MAHARSRVIRRRPFDGDGRLFYGFICFNAGKPVNGSLYVATYDQDGGHYVRTAHFQVMPESPAWLNNLLVSNGLAGTIPSQPPSGRVVSGGGFRSEPGLGGGTGGGIGAGGIGAGLGWASRAMQFGTQ